MRAGVRDRESADLGVIGAFGGAFGAEVGLGFGAVALAVGGVGVDREARGRVTVADLSSDGDAGEALELGGAQLDVQSRGGVGFCRWSGWRRGPV